jgi:hypothetical protein
MARVSGRMFAQGHRQVFGMFSMLVNVSMKTMENKENKRKPEAKGGSSVVRTTVSFVERKDLTPTSPCLENSWILDGEMRRGTGCLNNPAKLDIAFW